MEFNERLRKYRKDAKLTQIELAEKAGIAVNSLRLYEAGKIIPKIDTLQKIADVLNVPWYTLLGEDDELSGLVNAAGSLEYDSKKERPVIDADGKIYAQDLKTLEDLKDVRFKNEHPEHSDYSHGQISNQMIRINNLENLFYCLNEEGQKLLNEVARGLCMLDAYRIAALPTASDFLSYESALNKSKEERTNADNKEPTQK